MDLLDRLEATIRERRSGDPASSYVARVTAAGRARIAQKLGEEAVETVIAAVGPDPAAIVPEAADLMFHLLILLADAGLSLDDVRAELARREGTGGLDEKAARPQGLTPRTDIMPIDATLSYDDTNVFARILRGEIPSDRVYEDEYAIAFRDIAPQAPIHILVIPRGAYVSWDDFSARAPDAEIAGFVRAVGAVARAAGLVVPGYRLLANTGGHGGQEVPHLHVHLFGGAPLGPMLAR